MKAETFNVTDASKAQKELCKEKGYPHFAPYSGECYSCNENIYVPRTVKRGDKEYAVGVSVESASKSLITGCPHCHRSYCD